MDIIHISHPHVPESTLKKTQGSSKSIPGHFQPSLGPGAELGPGNKATLIHSLCTHGLASE